MQTETCDLDFSSPRVAHRIAVTHDEIWALLDEWADGADRQQPVDPKVMARSSRLLDDARRALSRHPLVAEVAPLPAEPPVMPADLFIRLIRAVLVLQERFHQLSDLSPQ
jgi:hypothetical protein